MYFFHIIILCWGIEYNFIIYLYSGIHEWENVGSQWVGHVPVNIVVVTFVFKHHLRNTTLKSLQTWQQKPQVKCLQSNVIS